MRCIFPIILFLLPCKFFSQVGIGTTDPKAQLDIIASDKGNPASIDGLLIPRITAFPAKNPSAGQHGMLIFLETEFNDTPEGFYYWHNDKNKWKTIEVNAEAADFYEEGTAKSPGNITEPIFRKGNIGIGAEEINSKLQIAINPDEDLEIKKGIEIDNNNSVEDNLTTYGISNENRSSTNGTKYGIKTKVAGDGSGVHYGIHSYTTQNTGTNDIYGFFNRVGRTYGADSDNFGIYTEIGSATGSGNIYGIYAIARGDHNADVYAGYFAGRLAIGKTPEEDYVLPDTRGEDSQVLVSDEDGEVNWQYSGIKNYSSTGGALGNYIIPDEVYTLRINSQVSAITIPDASENRGRILVLIGLQDSGSTSLNFLNGDTLDDLETGNSINAVVNKERMMIQSIGTRWLVLFRN